MMLTKWNKVVSNVFWILPDCFSNVVESKFLTLETWSIHKMFLLLKGIILSVGIYICIDFLWHIMRNVQCIKISFCTDITWYETSYKMSVEWACHFCTVFLMQWGFEEKKGEYCIVIHMPSGYEPHHNWSVDSFPLLALSWLLVFWFFFLWMICRWTFTLVIIYFVVYSYATPLINFWDQQFMRMIF